MPFAVSNFAVDPIIRGFVLVLESYHVFLRRVRLAE
jgi:hypothetical protein